jgi:hypothetical protein
VRRVIVKAGTDDKAAMVFLWPSDVEESTGIKKKVTGGG